MQNHAPLKSGAGEASIDVQPLIQERWDDLLTLFGKQGACSGCWCMWWRLSQAEFNRGVGTPNREAFQAIVNGGGVPGLLAYRHGQPVGWCFAGPRGEFGRLQRSPTLRAPDDQPVWSIVCFFIKRGHRQQGVARALAAAVRCADAHGARMWRATQSIRKENVPETPTCSGVVLDVPEGRIPGGRTPLTEAAYHALCPTRSVALSHPTRRATVANAVMDGFPRN